MNLNRVKNRSRRPLRHGFTMLEALVSLFVVSSFSLVLLSTNTFSQKLGRQSEARNIATHAAAQQLDSIVTVSQGNRSLATDQTFTVPSEISTQFAAGTQVRGKYSLSAVAGSKNLMNVTVTIEWRNLSSQNQSAWSSVTLCKVVASYNDVSGTYNGIDPYDPGQLFYTPPPPTPVVTTTTGTTGSTDSTTGSSTTTDGNVAPPSDGGGGGSTDGGTTGGGTDGGTGTATGGTIYYDSGYGNKW